MSSTFAAPATKGGAKRLGASRRDAEGWARSRRLTFLLLVAPSALLLLLINGYPLLYAAFQAVHDGSLLATGKFVGMKNFVAVLSGRPFWKAAQFTLLFTLSGVAGSWLIGMGLALLLRTRVVAGGLFKVLLLLPWVVPVVVSSMSWNWLVATPESPLPALARAFGFDAPLFLADPLLATITVCAFKIWCSFPFMMLMMSAALAGIDASVYEAAAIDGANARQRLVHITLPLTARSTFISWILMTIFCVNDFPSIYLLTAGGPVDATTSLVVLAFQTVFQNFRTGPGVAIAFIMTMSLVIVSVLLYRQIQRVGLQA